MMPQAQMLSQSPGNLPALWGEIQCQSRIRKILRKNLGAVYWESRWGNLEGWASWMQMILPDERSVLDLWGLYSSSHGCPNSCWVSPGSSDCKKFTCNAGDLGSILGLGSSPGGGHGNPFQSSYLENPMDRRAWWTIVDGITRVRGD